MDGDMCRSIYEDLMKSKNQDKNILLSKYEDNYINKKKEHNERLLDLYQNLINLINEKFMFSVSVNNLAL